MIGVLLVALVAVVNNAVAIQFDDAELNATNDICRRDGVRFALVLVVWL